MNDTQNMKAEIKSKEPKAWISVVLGFFFNGLSLIYVGRLITGILYILGTFLLAGILTHFTQLQAIETSLARTIVFSVNLICIFHSIRIIRSKKAIERKWYSRWYGLALILALILGPIYILRVYFYDIYSMLSSSMEPTLPKGSYVIVEKQDASDKVFEVEQGKMYVFRYPPKPSVFFVKRLVGLPGDKISYREKQYYINGVPVPQTSLGQSGNFTVLEETNGAHSYQIIVDNSRAPINDDEWIIPEDHYFFSGDNRDHSADSRVWGTVPKDHIVGKIVHVYQ